MTPQEKIKFKSQAQTRALVLPLGTLEDPEGTKRFDTEKYVEGYAARYEPYILFNDLFGVKVYERFERGCFDETDFSDVIMQYDHEGRVFARTTNGTLIVEPDETGLFMAADLNHTDGARDLYGDIEAKMITKMSWRFRIGEYDIEEDAETGDLTIVHRSIPKVYDVSAVSIPANDSTEINARSMVDGVIDILARREAERDDIKRRRLALQIKIFMEE